MKINIALAGNPNSGKSTLFNTLTGANQYVGNWPGVTVEKKTGKYKKDKDVEFTDLPGIYSLSPYTLEEVVSRDFLLHEKPDVIIDVIDATNIERNLYLFTQIRELGIPVVIALNMMDVVQKSGDKIDVDKLSAEFGVPVVEISALKNKNIDKLIDVAKKEAGKNQGILKNFSKEAEKVIEDIENISEKIKNHKASRWVSIKLLERDEKIHDEVKLLEEEIKKLDKIIEDAEEAFDNDGEGLVTDERYNYVSSVVGRTVKKVRGKETTSDKIDRIVTNRFLAIPIFAIIMFAVYFVAVTIVGGPVNDWWADGVMGDGLGGLVGG